MRFLLSSDAVRMKAIAAISQAQVGMTVRVWDDSGRSLDQNSLYWMWVKDFSDSTGYTTDNVHFEFKKRFLIPLFVRENIKGTADIVSTIQRVRANSPEDAETLVSFLIQNISTTDATKKIFTEYLDQIERFCHEKRVSLRHPQDIGY